MREYDQEADNFERELNKQTGDLIIVNESDYKDEENYPYYLIMKRKEKECGRTLSYTEYTELSKKYNKMYW